MDLKRKKNYIRIRSEIKYQLAESEGVYAQLL